MVFSSVIFVLVFLPVVLVIHSFLFLHNQNKKDKNSLTRVLNVFLLLSSIFFYAWGEPILVLLLLFTSYANYHIGLLIEREERSKLFLIIGLIINLGLLAYFKYAMLFLSPGVISILNKLLPQSLNIDQTINVILPLGISFYIFQAISYLMDIYRKKVEASQSFIDFACYLTMFPQLVAGPIVRYSQIETELRVRSLNIHTFSEGITRFIIGLSKKILIADTLGKVADAAFNVPFGDLTASGSWIGILCYTFQIYYDFSGYSDMAIGMGKMLGFSFPENFNYPYIANSIQDFWRRWHMSLSSWFKDYLYISLGGNRKGSRRTYFNLFLVFLLCGFWHGASWTFMVWGAYYGIFLVIERILPQFIAKMPIILRHIYVLAIVVFGWVLFRADSFEHALVYLKSMVGYYHGDINMNRLWFVWYGYDVKIALILATIFSIPVIPWLQRYWKEKINKAPYLIVHLVEIIKYSSLILLFLICLMPLFGATYKAFIYFRF